MSKLKGKQLAIFKLAMWSAFLTWMTLFLAYSISVAIKFSRWAPDIFGTTTEGKILGKVLPVWVIFTAMLTVYYMSKWATKKLKR